MKLKLLIATIGIASLAGAPAMAAEFSEADADADGRVTLEELQRVAPEVTEEAFNAYDQDLDGALIEPEFDAWNASSGEGPAE
jgi:Ca2+-binding EF-hand superfamily protein